VAPSVPGTPPSGAWRQHTLILPSRCWMIKGSFPICPHTDSLMGNWRGQEGTRDVCPRTAEWFRKITE